MMPNATVQTKGEAGQIFRLVGLLGSAWHPSLQSLFGVVVVGWQLFQKTDTVSANFFPSDPFLPLILTSPPPHPCFSLNTSSPLDASLLRPGRRSCQNQKKKEK